jgi:hypothetical protein
MSHVDRAAALRLSEAPVSQEDMLLILHHIWEGDLPVEPPEPPRVPYLSFDSLVPREEAPSGVVSMPSLQLSMT